MEQEQEVLVHLGEGHRELVQKQLVQKYRLQEQASLVYKGQEFLVCKAQGTGVAHRKLAMVLEGHIVLGQV